MDLEAVREILKGIVSKAFSFIEEFIRFVWRPLKYETWSIYFVKGLWNYNVKHSAFCGCLDSDYLHGGLIEKFSYDNGEIMN